MISHIDISSLQKDFEVDKDLAKYIQKKIGSLDRHLKRGTRDGVRADVKLKEANGKGGKKCTCEVILHLDGERLLATESTVNMYAAVDIVEQKLKNQIVKHKEKHAAGRDKTQRGRARRLIGKIFSAN